MVEHDLHRTQPNSTLSLIVVDFLISKHKSDMWHKEKILELMKIVERHPAGNVIRFGLLFYTPDLVKPRQLTANLNLRHNFLPLFEKVNNFIKEKMTKSCSRTVFGSFKKHVGMTSKLKSEAWEGFVPSNPSSIARCNKLTLVYQKERSVSLINSIESEVRAFPKVL